MGTAVITSGTWPYVQKLFTVSTLFFHLDQLVNMYMERASRGVTECKMHFFWHYI